MWMCGGIIGALTLSIDKGIQNTKRSIFLYILAYNGGRISGYMIAGTAAAMIGSIVFGVVDKNSVRMVIRLFVFFLMLSIGFYLAGWFPRLALVEILGKPLWRVLEPVGKKILPVKCLTHAFLFGIIWGWMPCGLSYSIMFWASSFSHAYEGALLMFFFGIGTSVPVMTAGMFTGWAVRLTSLAYANKIAALVIIIFSALNMLYLTGLDFKYLTSLIRTIGL